MLEPETPGKESLLIGELAVGGPQTDGDREQRCRRTAMESPHSTRDTCSVLITEIARHVSIWIRDSPGESSELSPALLWLYEPVPSNG